MKIININNHTRLSNTSIVKFLISAVVIFGLLGCGGGGGGSTNTPIPPVVTDATLTETLNNYLNDNQSASNPGLAIVVRKGGEIVYQSSKGLANRADNLAINPNTRFRTGSVTKPMTAIAIMQLVEQGLLSVDNKLLDHIPELAGEYADVTIHQLLTHQSGISDFINEVDDMTIFNNVTTSAFIDLNSLFNVLNFEPGTQGRYSNTGYVLLAVIVERVTGLSFPDYMAANVFSVLGMNDSYVMSEAHQLGEFGAPTALNYANTTTSFNFNLLIYGASNVISTIEDMTLFVDGWMSHTLVSEATQQLMLQSNGVITNIGNYGYGWITGQGRHNYTANDYWHTGGFDGYASLVYFSPDDDLVITVLSNGGETTRGHINNMVQLVRAFN
ncbi:MAG: D-alanyl-D-alanine carboxypeptidase [Alteromonadaceae bacterium]|jgi:D-alanyl-D-alanine carboxypeptidase